MDPAGADELRRRLEQQAHWRQAEAVGDGRQPLTDPDVLELEHMGEGIRLYATHVIHGTLVRQYKRLIEGVWVSGTIAETSDAELPEAVAQVA